MGRQGTVLTPLYQYDGHRPLLLTQVEVPATENYLNITLSVTPCILWTLVGKKKVKPAAEPISGPSGWSLPQFL